MLDPQDFDATKPLILSRDVRMNGHEMRQSEPVSIVADESDERGQLTEDQAARLWANGALVYAGRALATPVESPEQYARRATEVDDLGNGKHLIRAPWLSESVTVAADDLTARFEEIVAEGAETHRRLIEELGPNAAATIVTGADGFALADNGSGNFEITGPGVDQPIKVRGRQNAEDKLTALRAAAAEKASQPAGTVAVPGAVQPITGLSSVPTADAVAAGGASTDAT